MDRHLELLRLGSCLRPSGMNGCAGLDDSAGTAPLHGTQPLVPRHVGLDLFAGLEASQMREEKLMGPLWPSPRDVSSGYCVSRSVASGSSRPRGLQPASLLCPRDSPGEKTGVGCHFLLQGIFPTQGSKLPLLQWQAYSFLLSPQGSPKHHQLLAKAGQPRFKGEETIPPR